MTILKLLLPWINLFSLFFIVDSFFLHKRRNIPLLAKKHLTEETLDSFINRRIVVQLIFAAGFYGTTLSNNLPIDDLYKLIVSLSGSALLFIAIFLNIQNNRRYLNRWTASF